MEYLVKEKTVSDLRMLGIEDMMVEHWSEVGPVRDRIPLIFDWERALKFERLGMLRCYVLGDAELIGYNLFIVAPQLQYGRTTFAFNQGIYIRKQDRRLGAATALIRQSEEKLIKLGVADVQYHDSEFAENAGGLGRLLERLGYERRATIYGKVVQ